MVFKTPLKKFNTKYLLVIVLLCGLATLVSCKKIIEQQQKNIIIDAITTGHWYVQQYKKDSADITNVFAAYEFQFYENSRVDAIAIANNATQIGSWNYDIGAYLISAKFPPSANDTLNTLQLLNHTWKVTDSYLNYVEAYTATATGTNILHLRKK